jgi:hypothetical protein
LPRIAANPDINFLVVVNPNSGPGSGPLPGHDYVREVPILNSFPNVVTVGYVRIHYCKKPLAETCAEIDTYANWNRNHDIPGLHVQGIYVDETPNHESDISGRYLDHISHFIKHNDGLLGKRMVRMRQPPPVPPLEEENNLLQLAPCWPTLPCFVLTAGRFCLKQVVHNPGTPPEGDLASFGDPDLVCICEEPYGLYQATGLQKRLDDLSPEYERCVYQISGIPVNEMDRVVRELCQRGQFVFATDLMDDFYESFGPSWHAFVAAVKNASVHVHTGLEITA